jgi:hypothetical protein
MMIKRLELIEKIRTKIAERTERAANNRDRAVHDATLAEAEYVQQTSEAWSKFATVIRRRVRNGQPVTSGDVPDRLRTRSGWGETGVELFKSAKVKQSDYQPNVAHLQSMLLVLESSPDELISTSSLERLGAPVKELFR